MDINAVKEVWCKVKDELEKTLPEHIFILGLPVGSG